VKISERFYQRIRHRKVLGLLFGYSPHVVAIKILYNKAQNIIINLTEYRIKN